MFILPKGTEPNKESIKKAIEHNEKQSKDTKRLKKYYRGEQDILNRTKPEVLSNTKAVTNYPKYITTLNIGFLLGIGVEYQSAEYKSSLDVIEGEFAEQSINQVDRKIAKSVSKVGHGYEWVYATEDNNVRSQRIPHENCVVVYDDTLSHSEMWAVTYSEVKVDYSNPEDNEYLGVHVLTSDEIIRCDQKLREESRTPHYFQSVPLIEWENNDERMGDYEDVMTLIDAYNLLTSDRLNDKEQLVGALLILYGFDLTPQQKDAVKKYRSLSAPSKKEGADAEYLTKGLEEREVQVLADEIKQAIHKITMTPDMTDEKFVGNSSGVAIRYKIMPFSLHIQEKEVNFKTGLRKRLRLYNNYLSQRESMETIPLHKVNMVMQRRLPQNDFETSRMVLNLDGIVPREQLISQLSFVDNASESIERAMEEQARIQAASAGNFGFDQPNEEEELDEETEE